MSVFGNWCFLLAAVILLPQRVSGEVVSLDPSTAPVSLSWGIEGNGGSGVWNSRKQNWWNGMESVAWTAGYQAVFSGVGGTVTLEGIQTISRMTFENGDYTLVGDPIDVASVAEVGSDAGKQFVAHVEGTVSIGSDVGEASLLTGLTKAGKAKRVMPCGLRLTSFSALLSLKIDDRKFRLEAEDGVSHIVKPGELPGLSY